MTKPRLVLLLLPVAGLSLANMLAAQAKPEFSIGRVVPSPLPGSSSITIYPGGTLPVAATVAREGAWTVDVLGVPGNENQHRVLPAADVQVDTQGQVILLQTRLVLKGAKRIVVIFDNLPAGEWPLSKPPSQFITGAKSGEDPDISISASYSPAIGSPPQYSIDSTATITHLVGSSGSNYLGGTGAIKTDKRQSVNPDSYSGFFVYERILWVPNALSAGEPSKNSVTSDPPTSRLQGINFNWYVSGIETDSKANNSNYLSMFALTAPIRLLPGGPITTKTKLFSKLTLLAGGEPGYNITNSVTKASLGGFFRGYLGADFYLLYNFPASWHIKGLSMTSSYRVRLPAQPEVFTLTKTNPATGKTMDEPRLTTQARHHVQSELDLKFVDWFSIAVKDEYGEVPPDFRFIDHSVSIAFKVTLQQRGALRGAIVSR